jgi:hypothetical protein
MATADFQNCQIVSEHACRNNRSALFIGCRIRSFVTLEALGKLEADYPARFLRRQQDMLGCLIGPGDNRHTYDLRIISRPDREIYTKGRIEVVLLCRMDGFSVEQAEIHGGQLFDLLRSSFPEYDFGLVPAGDIPDLLEPFKIRHFARIFRRFGWNSLESVGGTDIRPHALGFIGARASATAEEEPSSVFHIYPYIPAIGTFHNLFHFMLLQPDPLAISFRMQPARLEPGEQSFVEAQIFKCERYAQVGLGQVSGKISILRPTLQQQARIEQQVLIRMLQGLKGEAALLTTEIASPGSLPQVLIDLVGHTLTRTEVTSESIGLPGGYQAQKLEKDAEAAGAFAKLAMLLPDLPSTPPEAKRLCCMFDSSEAAAAFRFPLPTSDALPGVTTRRWRRMPAPPSLPETGLEVAQSLIGEKNQAVRIAPEDRLRHLYIVGQTGTGKTTMLKSMIGSDLRSGHGICVIDPHGDLFRWTLAQIPDERMEDVVLLDPADRDFPIGLNMLECQDESHRHFLVQEMTGIIQRVMKDEHGQIAGEWMGPMFLQHVRMNLLLVMSDPENPGTIQDFYNIFVEPGAWKRWLPLKTVDPQLKNWVEEVLPRTDYFKGSDGTLFGGYIASKFEQFVFDPALRGIFSQKRSTINFRNMMDEGKILLVNLAKGEISDLSSRFLGMVLLAKLQAAAMGRVRIPLEQRRPFFIYVDEFQNIATGSFISMLSEGRKFGLGLILTNQFISQLEDRRIVESIFGNVGTLISFRVGQADGEVLEKYLYPVFSRSDLISLPNWHSLMSTLVNGQTVQPFSVETKLILSEYDHERADKARALSRKKYSICLSAKA